MKAPLSWLKEFLPMDQTPDKIAETLTLLGIEVEGIEGGVSSFSGVVVGQVLEASQHPNADRLKVAKVTDGTDTYQIVCGAPNCRERIFVALARCGAELTGSDGKKWKIKKSKLRDVESEGMLCSAKELGVGEESGGILELPEGLTLGQDLTTYFLDPIFDVSLTPNLGHCLSIVGIARELGAAFKQKVKKPQFTLKTEGSLKMAVEVKEFCARYACRIVTDVKVAPSPEWLQKKLLACGLRPINNLVDVTNYVMWMVGQPLHVFDKEKIEEKIVVAKTEEPIALTTLDGQNRQIPPGTVVIFDKAKPLALAGIMGGEASAVTDTTRHIVIESAHFDAGQVRRASRKLDLRTDGSYRFDRGVDPEGVVYALDLAAYLIHQIAGGTVHPLVQEIKVPFTPRTILCRQAKLQKFLGMPLCLNEAAELFERLEMKTEVRGGDLEVTPPSYRNDIATEVDLSEEIARLFGYNHIPRKQPTYTGSTLPDHPLYRLEKEVRDLLLRQGLQECITCNLISPQQALFTKEAGLEEVVVLHPRSVDQSVLRASLLPGLLQVAKLNLNTQVSDILAFEIGKVHFHEREKLQEVVAAALLLTGKSQPHHFDKKPADVDFFDLKGMIENLCEELKLVQFTFQPSHLHTLHPGRQASVMCGHVKLGVLGEVHPHLLAKLDIHVPIYFAELALTDILGLKKKEVAYEPVPLFPLSVRDWNITLKKTVPIEAVFETIHSIKSPFLEAFYLYDLYSTDPTSPEHKATFRFVYRDKTKTLDDAKIAEEHLRLTDSVEKKLASHI
jgi:phenylalanyl-tRNA synthetase beta chain